jgi:hypothetical protein
MSDYLQNTTVLNKMDLKIINTVHDYILWSY